MMVAMSGLYTINYILLGITLIVGLISSNVDDKKCLEEKCAENCQTAKKIEKSKVREKLREVDGIERRGCNASRGLNKN